MAPQPLLLLGAGGLAREVLAAARTTPERWRPLGMLDDDAARHGHELDGVTVLGGMGLVHEHADAAVIASVASPTRPGSRAQLVSRLALPDERWATIVHPAASLPAGVTVGRGTVLLAGVVVTAPLQIGSHVAVMPHGLITHDDEIGAFATLAGRVALGGGVRVGERAYLGQGALIREHLTIGEESVIGMGSAVLCDVPAGETWVGSPARRIRPR